MQRFIKNQAQRLSINYHGREFGAIDVHLFVTLVSHPTAKLRRWSTEQMPVRVFNQVYKHGGKLDGLCAQGGSALVFAGMWTIL